MSIINRFRTWNSYIKALTFSQRKRSLSSIKNSSDEKLEMYTADEQLTIIDTLHKCVQNNITRAHLNEKRLQSLKNLFEANPNLKSLEPLLTVNGIGPKLLHRICDSILQDPVGDETVKEYDSQKNDNLQKLRLPSGLVTPTLFAHTAVESLVSIKVGVNAISWARLHTNEGQVDSWDLLDITEWADKKYDVHSIDDLATSLREDVPDGDIYVLENNNWSNIANIKKPMKYHIQEAMLTTAICTMFNLVDSGKEPRTETNNRVYFLRSHTPFRLFNKIVGSERVSAEDIVQNMIQGEPDNRHKSISFINGTAEQFWAMNGSKRDSMCQALLLVVSFSELILTQNITALSIIAKPSSDKKNKVR